MITRSQLEQWVTYALANNSVILYDVAYQAYIRESGLPRSIYEIPGARECAMEFHSFSKDGGFTGVRCGYTVCPKDLFALTRDGKKIALHGLWSRRWSTKSNGVSYPVQRAAEALYSPEGRAQIKTLIDHYMTNAKILRQGCEAMGMQVFGGVNAPYVWVACPDGLNSWQMFDRMLQEANVVITPGVGFGRCGEGWFRISAFNSRENVEEVVKRMKAMVMQPA
jgi:LL-diaminopimelate aminotransferase